MGRLELVLIKDELLHLTSSTMEWGEDTGCIWSRHLDAGVNVFLICVLLWVIYLVLQKLPGFNGALQQAQVYQARCFTLEPCESIDPTMLDMPLETGAADWSLWCDAVGYEDLWLPCAMASLLLSK